MSWILAVAGFNPDKDGRKPRKKADKKKSKRETRKTDKLPDNVKTNLVTLQLEQYKEEADGTQSWQEYKLQSPQDRSPDLVDAEREHFATTKNFSVNKAEQLKPLWARKDKAGNYLTAKKAAACFTERGYSYETVRLYWRTFNRYNPSPTENERGKPQDGG